MEEKKVVFENESVSSLSSTLSKGNTGSVPVLLQAAIGFGPALVLNECLAKREAYRLARTRLYEGQKEGAYDAFVEGVWFPVPSKEIYASTGYENKTLLRYLSLLENSLLISVSQKKARLNVHNHDQIRHIRVADDIDEKLVTLAKMGYDSLSVTCPKLCDELIDGRPVTYESLLWSVNHRCHTINRFLVHTLGSPEITAIYNYIVSCGIQKRSDGYGAFNLDYNYYCERFGMSRPTLSKHLNHLLELNVIKCVSRYKRGTFVEPVMSGDLVIKQAILYGMHAVEDINCWTDDFTRSFKRLREKVSATKNDFEISIKNDLPKTILDKLKAGQKTIEGKEVIWNDALQKAKECVIETIRESSSESYIVTPEGYSPAEFLEKCGEIPCENFAYLFAYLANYGHTIDNRQQYIKTCLANDNGQIKHIAAEDIDFLRKLS